MTATPVSHRPTPGFPLSDFLGMVTEETAPGSATARLEVAVEHLNPHGSVHGGVMFTMVDTAMGCRPRFVIPRAIWWRWPADRSR